MHIQERANDFTWIILWNTSNRKGKETHIVCVCIRKQHSCQDKSKISEKVEQTKNMLLIYVDVKLIGMVIREDIQERIRQERRTSESVDIVVPCDAIS